MATTTSDAIQDVTMQDKESLSLKVPGSPETDLYGATRIIGLLSEEQRTDLYNGFVKRTIFNNGCRHLNVLTTIPLIGYIVIEYLTVNVLKIECRIAERPSNADDVIESQMVELDGSVDWPATDYFDGYYTDYKKDWDDVTPQSTSYCINIYFIFLL